MKNFKAYLLENIRWLAVIFFIALVMTATMSLNGVSFWETGYGMLLCGFVTMAAVLIGYGRHRESFRQLDQMRETIVAAPDDMKKPEYMYERQYQDCIHAIDQLLSNAVKYTKQGSVTIQVLDSVPPGDGRNPATEEGRKHGDEERAAEKENVHIIIEDTGIGISADDLPRVCEKGYTGCNRHADQYSTGIGLYLCKAILDKLGHQFIITSEKGKGTKAEIVIIKKIKE